MTFPVIDLFRVETKYTTAEYEILINEEEEKMFAKEVNMYFVSTSLEKHTVYIYHFDGIPFSHILQAVSTFLTEIMCTCVLYSGKEYWLGLYVNYSL